MPWRRRRVGRRERGSGGRVVAGAIGGGGRRDFAVIGDPLNTGPLRD
jgi:class 3 adenylate cyclase